MRLFMALFSSIHFCRNSTISLGGDFAGLDKYLDFELSAEEFDLIDEDVDPAEKF